MGGRQSSQNNTRQQTNNVSDTNTPRYSVGSLENESSVSRGAVLFSGPSPNVDLSSNSSAAGVVRRRRRRDRNDMFIETHSLPSHLFPTALLTASIKCPVCSKRIGSNEVESHLLVCLAKPRVSYNEDVLKVDAGECIICLDDMCAGDRIARLQCLCIYHKQCLDEWFQRNRCCPEHPEQAPQEYIETLPRNSARGNRITLSPRLDTSDVSGDVSDETIDPPLVANSLPTTLSVEHSPILGIHNDNSPSSSTSFITPDDTVGHSTRENTESPFAVMRSSDEDLPRTSIHVDEDSPRTIVHVDEGSTHGTTSFFNAEELAQLTSRKLNILVNENAKANEVNDT